MTRPVRLRLSRKRGFDLQAHSLAVNGLPVVNVARPGKWGNPYPAGEELESAPFIDADYPKRHFRTAGEAVECFRELLTGPHFDPDILTRKWIEPLRGKNLACWCPIIDRHDNYVPCHADVLLSIVNDIPLDEVIRENIGRAKGQAVR